MLVYLQSGSLHGTLGRVGAMDDAHRGLKNALPRHEKPGQGYYIYFVTNQNNEPRRCTPLHTFKYLSMYTNKYVHHTKEQRVT